MTGSSNLINYSVRQNKTIERALVFEGLRKLQNALDWAEPVYIGLGSAWFVDFDLAHRELGIETMISIESDDITFSRARFNKPFRTVELIFGLSYDETPNLLLRPDLKERPWVVWLDYDDTIDATKLDELRTLVTLAPPDSVIIATFNCHPGSYGLTNEDRLVEFREIFGDAFPVEEHPGGKGLNKAERLQSLLAKALLDDLESSARSVARDGGAVAGFNLQYQDGSPMVSAGVILPSAENASSVISIVEGPHWRGIGAEPISSPPLTPKEVAALRTLLPTSTPPSRTDLRSLGFDLPDKHLASFVRYYLDYPVYFQTAY